MPLSLSRPWSWRQQLSWDTQLPLGLGPPPLGSSGPGQAGFSGCPLRQATAQGSFDPRPVLTECLLGEQAPAALGR